MTQRGLVPRRRRSGLLRYCFPALPGWADVLRSALRALHTLRSSRCHFSLYLPRASLLLLMNNGLSRSPFQKGGRNCRSLGCARDDKGDGCAPIEVVVLTICLRMLLISPSTCHGQVRLLRMTRSGLVPRLRRSDHPPISQPFRAGLTFGGRPSGPCIHGDCRCYSALNLPQGRPCLGMTKARAVLP
jgi:hypothetical protein